MKICLTLSFEASIAGESFWPYISEMQNTNLVKFASAIRTLDKRFKLEMIILHLNELLFRNRLARPLWVSTCWVI